MRRFLPNKKDKRTPAFSRLSPPQLVVLLLEVVDLSLDEFRRLLQHLGLIVPRVVLFSAQEWSDGASKSQLSEIFPTKLICLKSQISGWREKSLPLSLKRAGSLAGALNFWCVDRFLFVSGFVLCLVSGGGEGVVTAWLAGWLGKTKH